MAENTKDMSNSVGVSVGNNPQNLSPQDYPDNRITTAVPNQTITEFRAHTGATRVLSNGIKVFTTPEQRKHRPKIGPWLFEFCEAVVSRFRRNPQMSLGRRVILGQVEVYIADITNLSPIRDEMQESLQTVVDRVMTAFAEVYQVCLVLCKNVEALAEGGDPVMQEIYRELKPFFVRCNRYRGGKKKTKDEGSQTDSSST